MRLLITGIVILAILIGAYYVESNREASDIALNKNSDRVSKSEISKTNPEEKLQIENDPANDTSVQDLPIASSMGSKLEDDFSEEENAIISRPRVETMFLIDQKDKVNPEVEFNEAKDFYFVDAIQGMFAGSFIDGRENIKLSIYSEESNGVTILSDQSCLQTPDRIDHVPPNLKIRILGNGLIAAKTENYYLRMGLDLTGKRLVIGKLFAKSDDKWLFVTDFTAEESTSRKILDRCQFE